jgi:hypothetical protein
MPYRRLLFYGLFSGLASGVLLLARYSLGNMKPALADALMDYSSFLMVLFILLGIYMGIRSFREKNGAGRIGFLWAFGAGLIIAFTASLVISVFNFICFQYLAPDAARLALEHYIKELHESSASPDYIAAREASGKFWLPSYMQAIQEFFPLMGLGILVSLICAAILATKKAPPRSVAN